MLITTELLIQLMQSLPKLIDTVPTEEELTAADVDDDGKITENDVNLILQLSATNFTHSFFRVQRLCILLPTTFRAELCIVTATALPTVRVRTQWEIQHILSAIMLRKYNMTMTNKATPGTTLAIRKDLSAQITEVSLSVFREMKGSL